MAQRKHSRATALHIPTSNLPARVETEVDFLEVLRARPYSTFGPSELGLQQKHRYVSGVWDASPIMTCISEIISNCGNVVECVVERVF